MQPLHPQPHRQAYYPPRQSHGFNPPPQQARPPQPGSYQQLVQPPGPGYVQQPQSHPQYQQQRPGQYYQQHHGFSPLQPQQYAPQPQAAHNQGYYPPAPAQAHPQYVPFTSHPHPPVVPPVRANSRSPEKAGRPLPPAAPVGTRQSPNTTLPAPIRGHVTPPQSQTLPHAAQALYTYANPPISSFSGRPPAQAFPRGQSFQGQMHVQVQPQPQTYHVPPTHVQAQQQPLTQHTSPILAHSNLSRAHTSINGTPPTSPVRTPESPSKRPLPAPPSGGAAPSPPATPSRSVPPGILPVGSPEVPAVDSPGDFSAGSPIQRRALPFSPTKPPDVEAGRSIGRRPIKSPQRSSTLPAPLTLQEAVINETAPSGTMDDAGQTMVSRPGFSHVSPRPTEILPRARNTGFTLPPGVSSKSSTGFALPPQQKPTQSLAFRLASLSLQEEQSQKRPVNHTVPRASQVPTPAPTRNSVPPSSRSPARQAIDLDDAPPTSTIRVSSFESKPTSSTSPLPQPPSSAPAIDAKRRSSDAFITPSEAPSTPSTTLSASVSDLPSIAVSEPPPSINVSEIPTVFISETPSITVSDAPPTDSVEGPSITVSEATPKITVSELPAMSTSSVSSAIPDIIVADLEGTLDTSVNAPVQKRKGLICYGCGKGILGRIVSAMGGRWHPACFKCTVCSELLEHVSSYEHAGRPYCHLDYHEKFAPQCYHCRTPIIDERFITLDDPALGKRMYHEQHFFCAECGDPFLAPTIPGKPNDSGVVAQDDDVGFTVYKGHPYCEACHVRLRYPKCKRCKKSIRDGVQAVEALGGKWCWECFLCAGCEKPFDDPAFFQRDNKAYCEACFSVIIKSEL